MVARHLPADPSSKWLAVLEALRRALRGGPAPLALEDQQPATINVATESRMVLFGATHPEDMIVPYAEGRLVGDLDRITVAAKNIFYDDFHALRQMVIQNDRDLEGAIHNARRMATDRVSMDLKKTSEQLDRLRRTCGWVTGPRKCGRWTGTSSLI